jgi:menaquinol-cytochrome c reductase iron-sulfur subunit
MTDLPMLARVLLRTAYLLMPKGHRAWLEAMSADLADAQHDGRAAGWAVGCLVAALRLRMSRTAAPSTIGRQGESKPKTCRVRELSSADELNRRTFMANAVVAIGGTISLGLTIPLLTSLTPATAAAENEWSPLPHDQWTALQKATDTPVKVTFSVHDVDGYLPAADAKHFVWAVKVDEATMRATRPELFAGATKIAYPIANLGFTLFSPVCPHLGGRYEWIDGQSKFHCPLHGSEFTKTGARISGPAQRGLDPLPLRQMNRRAQVTWIEFKGNTPDRIVIRIG